jgi:serine/threonine protein kinase
MNILVTDDGTICLSDVGLNTCLRNSMHDCSIPVPSSWMYKAPEELKAESDFKPTQATDVYAFASTVYSVSPRN